MFLSFMSPKLIIFTYTRNYEIEFVKFSCQRAYVWIIWRNRLQPRFFSLPQLVCFDVEKLRESFDSQRIPFPS